MKKLPLVLLLLLFLASYVTADVITMKNGAKYGGIIIEYLEGKYILKNKGKKYPVAKSGVKSIKWSATQAQLDEAFAGERWPAPVKEKKVWPYIDLKAEYLLFIFPGITSDFPGGMVLASAAAGGYSKENASFTGAIKLGYMSGKLSYREPNAAADSETEINSGSLMFVFDWDFRLAPQEAAIAPFIGFGAGMVFMFDYLSNYPMGWKRYASYPVNTLDPDMVSSWETRGLYIGLTGKLSGGLDFSLSDGISAVLKGGIMWLRKNNYHDVFKYEDRIDVIGADFIEGSLGLQLEAGIRFKF